ncbi:MAG: thiol:disulfide interchange protein [Gallionellales bacterium RIFCSPLOWO2_12_FULL_59_22]|nr:MAG: thiol:disulfide interchange protein [Gallionellales bacterium RIFCSPLOWO2_02_FULL_59_110]OGT12050.1 MAG: thiol:disulfide interchange protein [Gallionellales bacterium RIFCSPLOWO2_12_FULL_59_22]
MAKSLVMLLCLMAPAANAGLLDRLPGLGGKQPTFLPPDQAFGLQVMVRDAYTLQASLSVTPGYYLYRDKIRFEAGDGTAKVLAVNLPRGEMKQDPSFGNIEVFHSSIQAEITLERPHAAATVMTLNATYMGCSEEGLCYPPINKTLRLDLPDAKTGLRASPTPAMTEAPPPSAIAPLSAGSTSSGLPDNENTRIAQLFKGGSFWLIVSFFFGAGLLLALTPCVFPMIPILSGIIVGRGHKITKMHAFILSLAYVLGMALTYAAAGVAAGLSGSLISNALQTPWVLGSFSALFVLLSLSMFGFYEFQLPTALQSKLTDSSNRLHGGHLSGVFAMGALSAVIMGPCVAAPLAGALLYIGQTHDAVLGGVALFALALGMGAPLLLIGTSAGVLLPKAGAWMEAVKKFFGVMLLALAIWIVQPLLPISVQMLLWAALLIFSGIYLRALDTLPHNANGWHRLLKGIGLIALLLGISYLIGALSGARDILRPLGNIGRAEIQAPATLQFSRVHDIAELDRRIAQARGQAVMLDFYADWCVSCKEMERFTFADAAVQAKLKPVLLLQADVTANSEADQALLKRFGLYGPPGILFFDAQGKEMGDFRVIGYQNAAQFLKTLQNTGL